VIKFTTLLVAYKEQSPPASAGLWADLFPRIFWALWHKRDLILQVIELQSLVSQPVALTLCH